MKNENINKQIMNKQEQFYAKLALKNHYLIKMNDIINIFLSICHHSYQLGCKAT